MTTLVKQVSARLRDILATGIDFEAAARKLSVEFHITAYVNKGKLWGRFKDESGAPQIRVFA